MCPTWLASASSSRAFVDSGLRAHPPASFRQRDLAGAPTRYREGDGQGGARGNHEPYLIADVAQILPTGNIAVDREIEIRSECGLLSAKCFRIACEGGASERAAQRGARARVILPLSGTAIDSFEAIAGLHGGAPHRCGPP